MEELNRTTNSSTGWFEEAAYVRTIPTAGTEVIDKLTGADPGYPYKPLKIFVPPNMETLSDTVISRFITKLQVHLNHSTELIVGAQSIISFLNRNIVDVPEDHTNIWCAMGDIMKKLVSHGAVLNNFDLDLLMKEAREAHLLTVNKNFCGWFYGTSNVNRCQSWICLCNSDTTSYSKIRRPSRIHASCSKHGR